MIVFETDEQLVHFFSGLNIRAGHIVTWTKHGGQWIKAQIAADFIGEFAANAQTL